MTWIDRTLLLGPRVAVVTTERQFRRVARSLGVADAAGYVGDGWLGAVHAYDVGGELVCVVGLNLPRLAQLDGIDVAALIVHEAVHVWQRVRDALAGDVGREGEAYAVQNIAAGIMRAYVKASSSAVV